MTIEQITMLLISLVTILSFTILPAQAQTPSDEGGPVVVTGEVSSANFTFRPEV
jgi:hypothetical protein